MRELCQTSIDGASIDTIEDVAGDLGLEAEQLMLPADHLFASRARVLPAMVVVRRPTGVTHFVVAWRLHGRLVQVMDPAAGRRWLSRRRFLDEIYVHTQSVPAAGWRAWAGTEEFLDVIHERMEGLGISSAAVSAALDVCRADETWRALAGADASTRMIQSLVDARGLRKGRETEGLLEMFAEAVESWLQGGGDTAVTEMVPEAFWSVRPSEPGSDDEEQLDLKGVVALRVRGRSRFTAVSAAHIAEAGTEATTGSTPAHLRGELDAVVSEPPPRPLRMMLDHIRRHLATHGLVLAVALILSSATVLAEAILFRGLIDLGGFLVAPPQRLGAVGFLLLFLAATLLLELPIGLGLARLGRHLEGRLRMVVAEKIPRISDAYFRSRLASDMAERFHHVHLLRLLPASGGGMLRIGSELVLTAVGLVWLEPAHASIALVAVLFSVGVPLAVQPLLSERDLRVRSHTGGLGRYYLDALLGLVAIRSHRAEPALRREHEGLLVEWVRAGRSLLSSILAAEGLQLLTGYGFAAWLVVAHLETHRQAGGVLLLVFWALKLPTLGWALALSLREYPMYRNISLRIHEPLGAPDEIPGEEKESKHGLTPGFGEPSAPAASATSAGIGIGLSFSGVTVRAAGNTILSDINLEIKPGSRVAIVGSSGAGKSTLMGLILGWHRPWTGCLEVDGQALDGTGLIRLRQQTAWIDPTVRLWNRTLLENLFYGAMHADQDALRRAVEAAELVEVLEDLPRGFQTSLGEGGGLLSGGQGQRVRLARGMMRSDARLVILDEAFRGFDRRQRRHLLEGVCRWWPVATLLCVTHDLEQTRRFDQVVVIEAGRVVESGAPEELQNRATGRYRALLDSEGTIRRRFTEAARWRRLRLENRRISEVRADSL